MRTQRPGHSALLFLDGVELLDQEHIDYLPIGALALSASKSPFAESHCAWSQDLEDARPAFEGAQGPLDLDLLRAVTRRFGRDAADRLQNLLK